MRHLPYRGRTRASGAGCGVNGNWSTRTAGDGTICPMSDTVRPTDPSRPRYLGVWVAVVLLLVLFGGASSIVADVLFRLALGI